MKQEIPGDDFDQVMRQLAEIGAESWETFRLEASKHSTGTAFRSLKTLAGSRKVMLACITEDSQIASIERLVPDLEDSSEQEWRSKSLTSLLFEAALGKRLRITALRGPDGKRKSVLIAAATSSSIDIVETMLGLRA